MIEVTIKKSIKNVYDDKSGFVSFEYDPDIVDVMRSLPMRWYHPNTREWEVSEDAISILSDKLPNEPITIKGRVSHTKVQIPQSYTFVTTPYKHQLEGIEYGLSHDRWLLGDEQGLGKTKQVIDLACIYKQQNKYKHCIIICGVNGLKYNWAKEIEAHSVEDYWFLGQRFKNGVQKIQGNVEKLEDLRKINDIRAYFILTNIESLRSHEIALELKNLCDSGMIEMIAVDEIHKCCNPTSQQSKGLLALSAKTMIAMTGTPLMNKPLDLYLPLKWLGYEQHNYYMFKQHYANYGGFGGYQIVGYKNMDELQTKLNKIMLRRKKTDVLDLPDKIYTNVYTEMGDAQNKLYNDVLETIKADIDKIILSPNPLSQLIRLRQVTGYPGIISSTVTESAKMDTLIELVSDSIDNGHKVIIYSNWAQMTLPIYNRIAVRYCGAYITGEVDTDQRQQHVKKFQEDDNCKFIVGTIGAMGTGLTLTAADTVIFMDEPWTKAAYDQAVDRCHRIGTKNTINIYNIITKDTIDERIHEILYRKSVMSDALVDGSITGDKLQMLNYLIS